MESRLGDAAATETVIVRGELTGILVVPDAISSHPGAIALI
jgi:hypothetical protein